MRNIFDSQQMIVGCWQLDDRSWTQLDEASVRKAVFKYLDLGLSVFDTADIYGRSEKTLGKILDGVDCTILTKAVFFDGMPSEQEVRSKINSSLKNLRRDSLDCVQVHWHDPSLNFEETFRILLDLKDEGKIKHISLTNFNSNMTKQVLKITPIFSHQVQYSLIDRRVENSMQDLCCSNNIMIIPYGAIAGGYLSEAWANVDSYSSEEGHARSRYYKKMIEQHGGWAMVQTFLNKIIPVAASYNVSVDQLAQRWLFSRPGVGAVITGLTLDEGKIKRNAAIPHIEVPEEELKNLSILSDECFENTGDIYSYERS